MNERTKLFAFLLAAGLIFHAAPAQAGWRELKPIFGGAIYEVVPDAGGSLYARTSGGLVRSTDGGQTWASALGNLATTQVVRIVADPVEVGVIYVGTDKGLFRTTDAGNTWTRLPLNLPAGTSISEIAVAPTNTNHIFVATWGSYVWRSLDRGATWQQRAAGLYGGWGGPAFITSMAVDPTNANRVYTSTWRGRLFRSDDAATTWYQIADSGTWANGQIYVSRSSPNVLYTIHDEYWFGRGTILKSVDYGNSWSAMARPAAGRGDAGVLAIDPTNANVAYVTSSQGIHKTTTGGGAWTRIFSPAGQTYMTAVAVAPGSSSNVYAGSYYYGFYRSLDAGGAWTQHNTGIASASITGIEICRDVPSTMYAGAQGVGYLKSTDGGSTWGLIGTAQGLENHSLGGLSVHPQNPNVVVTSSWHASTGSVVWRTTDGGASFGATASGYGSSYFEFNPLDPSKVSMSIADWQGGFLFSSNGGANWFVPTWWYIYPQNYDFHPTLPNVVFSVGGQYTGAPLTTMHVLWSNAGGASGWTGTSFGQGRQAVVALDKNDPTTLYFAGSFAAEATEGVYKFKVTYSGSNVASVSRVPGTFNNGLTSTSIRRLVYDKTTGTLYASTPNGVFRSRDQANSWTSINDGLPYLSTSELAITPDGSRLIAATSAGIWEFSESIPVSVAVPAISTTPPDLMQKVVLGTTHSMGVSGQTTTVGDTIDLGLTTLLESGMAFSTTSGNPATGAFTFLPGGNQKGQTYALIFTAASTLDPSKTSALQRYVSVIGSASSDTAALLSTNSGGSVNTPDGKFSMDIAPGSIPSADGIATVNVVSMKNTNTAGAYVELPSGRRGNAKATSIFDITINGLPHYTFLNPVALTFAVAPGAVADLSQVKIMVYDESRGAYVQATDTSCLAAFGRQPYTGTASAGGTVSVCTTTVSTWAAVDLATFVEEPTDTAAPSVSASASPGPNANGWNNTDVTVSLTAADEAGGSGLKAIEYTLSGAQIGSGVSAGPTALVTISAEGSTTITYVAEDNAGHRSAPQSTTIRIDRTAPQVSLAQPFPAPNAAGWHNTVPVTVAFTTFDALSGYASTSASSPLTFTEETPGATQSVTVTDLAGNSATYTSPVVRIDRTAPVVTFGAVSPEPNAAGWNNSDPVSVPFSTFDNLSGYASTSASSPFTFVGETPGSTQSVTVSDLAGNSATYTSPTVKIDETAPTVSVTRTPEANTNGWNDTDVTAHFTATDGLSGVVGDPALDVVFSTEGAGQTATRQFTDQAGNTASAAMGGISIDKTPPVVNITGVADGASYTLGCVPTAGFTASDALSGVETSSGALTGGNANGVGEFSYTAKATDLAGNTTTRTASYSARYQYTGFFTPISNDGSSVFKLGSSVPIKFEVRTCNGTPVSMAVATLAVFKITDAVLGSREEVAVDASGNSNLDNLFRFSDPQYIYNLNTKPFTQGTHTLQATLDDGTVHSANVSFKAK